MAPFDSPRWCFFDNPGSKSYLPLLASQDFPRWTLSNILIGLHGRFSLVSIHYLHWHLLTILADVLGQALLVIRPRLLVSFDYIRWPPLSIIVGLHGLLGLKLLALFSDYPR